MKKPDSVKPGKIIFKDLAGTQVFDSANTEIDINNIERLVVNGKIPILSLLNIQTASGDTAVHLAGVLTILIPNKKNGKIKGLVIGAVADVLGLYAVGQTIKDAVDPWYHQDNY
jgi:hypothetical protein